MPLPAKLEMLPPWALMSAAVKFVEASESVKVSDTVSPALRVKTLLEMAIVGATVSTVTEMGGQKTHCLPHRSRWR